jgi:periplasmic protein TonB
MAHYFFFAVAFVLPACCISATPSDFSIRQDTCTILQYDSLLEKYVYKSATTPPEFVGGVPGVISYIRKHINYVGLKGQIVLSVDLSFVVDDDGSIKNITVIAKKFTGKYLRDAYLEQEFIRVMSSMPKWNPAKCGDRNIAILLRIPYSIRVD